MKWTAVLLILPAALAQQLTLLPRQVTLTTPESRQQLIAQAAVAAHVEDWTRTAQWSSSNPNVATVDQTGLVKPIANGEATITARANNQTATVLVTVKASELPFVWNFKNHVIPVLTKTGCNQGACHGALAGKNGFKLTLRGYDPDVDFDTLTRQSLGRRISLADPPSSLILKKATFGLPHGGGKRFAG